MELLFLWGYFSDRFQQTHISCFFFFLRVLLKSTVLPLQLPTWWFLNLSFPCSSPGKNLPAMQETWIQSLGWEDPLERKWQPTPGFLPGKSHGQRSLVSCSPWGRKESGTTEWLTVTYLLNKLYSCTQLLEHLIRTWEHCFC